MRQQTARTFSELESQFREIIEAVRSRFLAVDPGLLRRRPGPESWSAAECFAHLNVSIDLYFPVWAAELEGASHQNPEPQSYKTDFWGRLLIWTLEPPPRFRMPAPRIAIPVVANDSEDLVQGFLDRQEQVLETLRQARGLAVDRIKITSPFDRRVRYSVWSSFCVTASHERRHLLQAEQAIHDASPKA